MKKSITKILTAACAVTLAAGFSVFGSVGFASDAGHRHSFSSEWSSGEKNHWHASDCGHDIVSGVTPHNFVDGKCADCGYVEKEEHTHTYGNEWKSDSLNHWHAASCEHDIVRDMASHTYENGKCTVCGYDEPAGGEHVHKFAADWQSDELNHWHESTCGDNIVSGMAAHNKDGANGGCSVCGKGETTVDPNPVEPDDPNGVQLTASGAYSEGMYAEWKESAISKASVYYQAKGASQWTKIDSELVRMISSDTARADIVGIKAGDYNIKIESDGKEKVKENIKVSAYDRSGYAHFNYTSGVGAYKDDGTPKSNATIIYVNESNKNTVTASLGGKNYTGIANILSNSSKSSNPLIVRIVGRVAAATWKKGNVTYTKTASTTVDGTTTGNLKEEVIVGKNGKKLPTSSSELTQDALIEGGYNELQTDISVLKGLSSKATYKSGEYDSAWNNCSISGAKNVTVEGIGTDAEIFQWGFTWSNCNSIEVRNLTFDDYTEDACSFEGGSDKTSADSFEYKHFWLHHNIFNEGINYWDVCPEQDKHEGDGATDFKKISYLTTSYNVHYLNHKTGLVGGGNTQMTASITFHHNYYRQCSSRLPLARQANMHMYNNYYYGSTGTNMSLRASAVALIEYCYFENAMNPVTVNDNTSVGLLWNCTVVKGKSSSTDLKTVANQVVKLSTRDSDNGVTNSNNANSFGGLNYYLNSSLFYFTSDSAIKNNAYFVPTAEVPTKIPTLAGVHKNAA